MNELDERKQRMISFSISKNEFDLEWTSELANG